jgi:methyl-accepting chemotaxis protein
MSTRKPTGASTRKVPSVSELPVTRSMLHGVRDELNARFDEVNARFEQVNARIDEVSARIDQTNARIDQLDASMRASARRLETLAEEQEARNRVVLEVVQGHNARFERIEARLDEMQGMFVELLDLARNRPR